MNAELKAAGLRATESLALPAPRLQLTWLPILPDWSQKICVYTLVLPLGEYDIRREGENYKKIRSEWHAEIGLTKSTGGRKPVSNSVVEPPYRDGAHARWDSRSLGNLPVYAVCENVWTLLTPSSGGLNAKPTSEATASFQ